MTPQFTTPCYIRIDDLHKRIGVDVQLEKLGYEWAISEEANETVVIQVYSHKRKPYRKWVREKQGKRGSIDCGTNIALFLDLAGMRSDTYADQLMMCESRYTDPKLDYSIVEPGTIIRFGEFDEYAKAFYHRATATEIIEWHKLKGEQK